MTHDELRDYIDKFDAAGMVNEPAVKALRAVVELCNFLDKKGERVLKQSQSWKIEDKEGFETFYSRLENACNDAGLRAGLEKGYCPALIAENDVIKIEWEISLQIL